jgi:hypothetical protein
MFTGCAVPIKSREDKKDNGRSDKGINGVFKGDTANGFKDPIRDLFSGYFKGKNFIPND